MVPTLTPPSAAVPVLVIATFTGAGLPVPAVSVKVTDAGFNPIPTGGGGGGGRVSVVLLQAFSASAPSARQMRPLARERAEAIRDIGYSRELESGDEVECIERRASADAATTALIIARVPARARRSNATSDTCRCRCRCPVRPRPAGTTSC